MRHADYVAVSDQVEKSVGTHDQYNGLIEAIPERLATPEAIRNYAKFYGVSPEEVTAQEVSSSSAGIHGWSETVIEDWMSDRLDDDESVPNLESTRDSSPSAKVWYGVAACH